MKWMKTGLVMLFAGMMAFLPVAAGECAVITHYKMTAIAPVGQFWLPSDLAVEKFPKAWSSFDNNTKLDPATMADVKQALGADAVKEMENYDMETYQLAFDDGETYHVAWLMALRDKRPLNKEAAEMMKKILTPEEKSNMEQAQVAIKVELMGLNEKLKNLQAEKPGEASARMWIKVLGLTPVEHPLVANTQGYGAGLRVLLRTNTLHVPLFVKGYAMGPDNHLSILAFVTLDSDRDFWSPVWTKAVGVQEPLAQKK